MLLLLDDEHKKHLEFLQSIDTSAVTEFARVAVEFIKNGTNPKMYSSAAQKLGVESTDVQKGVEGLMRLFLKASQHSLSAIDFQESVLVLGLAEEVVQGLCVQYADNAQLLRKLLSEMAFDLPHYHNLEWRLDVQLASRSLTHQVEPQVLLKLRVKEGDETDVHLLQTDPTNLLHLTQELEGALNELKTAHCRRIQRNL